MDHLKNRFGGFLFPKIISNLRHHPNSCPPTYHIISSSQQRAATSLSKPDWVLHAQPVGLAKNISRWRRQSSFNAEAFNDIFDVAMRRVKNNG
jgi:hypothetical protein